MNTKQAACVWLDGRLRAPHEARVPVFDHGLLYGDGVFEGIRITAGRVFRLERHLERLERSARAIGLALPYPRERIAAIVLETAAAFGHEDAYVRVLLTRGSGELSLDPDTCDAPRLICIVAGIRLFDAERASAGVKLTTASTRRPAADMLDPQVKSLNYLNNVLARREARLHGCDDALILNDAGRVAEASGANVFACVDGELITPPAVEGALPGITRAALVEAARAAAIPVFERPLARYALLNASEVLLCGSGAGLVPVASVDGCVIGDGSRAIVDQLRAAYREIALRDGTPFDNAAAAEERCA